MRTPRLSRFVLVGCTLLMASPSAWARLPVPYNNQGTVASVDKAARVVVLAEPPKPKFRLGKIIKPTTFVWNERTQFIKNGQPADAASLSAGTQARLHYWYPPKKGRPWLVKVVWENGDRDSRANE